MFLAPRLAPPSSSVDRDSREALYKSQAARLTVASRLDWEPTDSLPVLPKTITQVLCEKPSSVTAATLAVGGWRRKVLVKLDGCRRSCARSVSGMGPVRRISTATADATRAIGTTFDRSPAVIARGREIGTTAATPAHLGSAAILWSTGCATVAPALYNGTAKQTVKGLFKADASRPQGSGRVEDVPVSRQPGRRSRRLPETGRVVSWKSRAVRRR